MLVGVADHLRDAGKSRKFVRGALGIATGDHDAGLRIFAMDAANGGARVLIGGCRYGAGIQDDHFGLIERRGAFQAALFELALDGGAVGLGRAAAKILYVVTCHRTIVAALSRQSSVVSRESSGEKQASGSGKYPSPAFAVDLFNSWGGATTGTCCPIFRVHGAGMTRRVLLVDDDATVLLTLKAVLELHHFDVETAATTAEARAKLAAHEYDLVVTDVRMENDESGFEVLRAAREQRYQPATAILTAYPPQEERLKAETAASFLVKPIGTRQLIAQLETLIARRAETRQT